MEDNVKEIHDFTCEISPHVNNNELKPNEQEVYKTVEGFKKQMIAYMNCPEADVENAIPSATQELEHSFYLQKKRLLERGIRIHYAKFLRKRSEADGRLAVRYDTIQAKRQMICTEYQRTDYEIRYIRDDKLLGAEKKDKYLKHYVFRAKNANGMYECPSCGAVQSLEALLDGCDYCKEVFDINAYEDKVASVCDERATRYTGEKKRKKYTLFISVLLLLFSLFFCGIPFLGLALMIPFNLEGLWFHLLGMVVFGFIGLVCAGVMFWLLFSGYWKQNNAVKKYDQIYDEIAKYNPDFDMDQFVSMMDSKIKAMYYAAEKEDIDAFAIGKVDSFPEGNRDVISCDVNQIELQSFRTDENYQYVEVYRDVHLTRDMGNAIAEENRPIIITLCKKKDYKIRKDIVMYRCNNCGSSISLRGGGVCKHCGTRMDYMLYDWAIVGMRYADKMQQPIRTDDEMDPKLKASTSVKVYKF